MTENGKSCFVLSVGINPFAPATLFNYSFHKLP